MVGFIAKLATQCAKDLERPSRAELIATLVAAEPVEPRKVWPAVIQLAGDDLDAHADLLDRFTGLDRIRGDTWEAARNSALKTWFDTAPLEFLRQHAATLHASLPATQKNARTRATLDGRLALFDDQARTSLHQTVVRGSAVLTASEATRSLSRSAAELDVVLDVAGARWFLDLLATPHTGAATELARALCDETRLPDPVLTLVTSSGGAVLVRQRLQQAVSSKRSTDLPATLVELLARMNRVASLPRDESRRVLDTVTGPVLRIAESSAVPLQATAQNDLATNFACWVTTVTRLALHSLPAAEVAASVRLVLSGWDPRQIGNRVERDVVTLLIAVLHHHPQFADWLVTELWPASGPGTKRAIAEAFAVHERRTPGHRALTLAQSPDCPPTWPTVFARGCATDHPRLQDSRTNRRPPVGRSGQSRILTQLIGSPHRAGTHPAGQSDPHFRPRPRIEVDFASIALAARALAVRATAPACRGPSPFRGAGQRLDESFEGRATASGPGVAPARARCESARPVATHWWQLMPHSTAGRSL